MMKRVYLTLIASLIALGFIRNFSFSVSEDEIIGAYENTNFSNRHYCVEAPHVPDRLILKPDYTFSSTYYGIGDWKRNGSRIELHWKDENGGASMNTYFTNRLFEEPRIVLNADLEHYYGKVKE